MWLRSTVVLKHASFVILYASGLDVLRGLVPQWLRTRYRLFVSSARGRTLPSGAALGSLGSVLGASGTSWGGFWSASGTPWGGFWELRRRLGRLLGLLGPLGTPLGASGAPQGGSWVLPEHLREALGSSRDALGSVLGCFWDVLGSILGLRESVGSGKDEKVKIIVLPKEFIDL